MSPPSQSDSLLIQQIRQGEADAWSELIARFEGRLLAYVDSRLRNRTASEDVVQETFVGFLTSLPNYDSRRPLESYLFSIAAHKLTDHLRREGLDQQTLEAALREHGVAEVRDVEMAVLEIDGSISVVPIGVETRHVRRPVKYLKHP